MSDSLYLPLNGGSNPRNSPPRRRILSLSFLSPQSSKLLAAFSLLSLAFILLPPLLNVSPAFTSTNLAVVMPFAVVDVEKVVENVRTWEKVPPCSNLDVVAWSARPVFYFYSNKELEPAQQDSIRTAVSSLSVSLSCFKSFNFVAASIAADLDHYDPDARDSSWVAGPNEQFYQLVNNTGVVPNDVTHIFMMEPDTRPIRSQWVSQLHSILRNSDPFWIRGSAFRGACVGRKTHWETARPDCHQLGDLAEHLNGNALYGVGDAEFRAFLTEVRGSNFAQWPFDLAWYKFLGAKGMERRKAALADKFVFSELIRNYGASEYDFYQVVEESSWTFFIHSDKLLQPFADPAMLEEAIEVNLDEARAALPSELLRLLDEKALRSGDIMISFTTGNYGDMAANFVHFVRAAGIDNFIMVAMDENALTWARSAGVPTYGYFAGEGGGDMISGSDSYWSEGFRSIVTKRARLMAAILRAGFNVLESDVDIVWLKNPFHLFFEGPYELEVQSDAPVGYVEDDDQARFPQFVNSGCFYARGTARMADFFAIWADAMVEHADWLDQQALNNILSVNLLRIKFRIMDPVLVPNGFAYFQRTVPQRAQVQPVAIHNNWIDGGAIKQYRFRDAGLWTMDPPSYFDTTIRKYLAVSIPSPENNGWSRTRNALHSAIAIADILNRTLILPRVYLYEGRPHTVTLNTFIEFKDFMTQVPDFREATFLERVFPSGPSRLFEIDIGLPRNENPSTKTPIVRFTPEGGHLGATDVEIQRWFEPYANDALIQFTDLYNRFDRVVDHAEFPNLNTKLAESLKPGAIVQQIAAHMADILVAKGKTLGNGKLYNCAFVPRGVTSGPLAREMSVPEIVDFFKKYLNPAELVYVISDIPGLEAAVRNAFPHSYFPSTFEKEVRRLSKPDDSEGRSMLVEAGEHLLCGWADRFVGNIDTPFTSELCRVRQASGRSGHFACKDLYHRPWP